ncbi:hypothetical protein EN851_25020 [Mesorhizobium sp. M8A.F.Ca.ET.208.01.1.1]|uniref:hypothetical protein n=1 Tax=unclassified Mesorhizobium TaxID=325217 RepID=UPI001093DC72|nr:MULTISPECIES: hypothetical protein [unclassified Mesorhizobium]TGQ88810.1 hypothetical protein EN851_25020 [Mesorhizobium sp. M8A.F.Ca.ET.208.01.1.1]TGT50097.1 hypothetical protein EN810_24920 [Mesorhizobium sp. M8A.F.Ca.ET.167.01.1.1]
MTFINRMIEHWTYKLGLSLSEPLVEGWLQLEQATERIADGAEQWQVVQLPTGSGKTEALKVLCSVQHPISHPHILIVTKFNDEADQIALGINELAGWAMARSVHSEAPWPFDQLGSIPVLVITHSAYRLALKEVADSGNSPRLDHYYAGMIGRQWVIIDEAFDWVDAHDIELGDMRSMCGDLAGLVQGSARADAERLHSLATALTEDTRAKADKMLGGEQFDLLARIEFGSLQEAIASLPENAFAAWDDTQERTDQVFGVAQTRTPFKTRYLNLMSELETIARIGFAWTTNRRGKALLHTSRSLLEVGGKHGVILDATADIDPTYSLMGTQVRVLPRPEGIRSYTNVRLHLSYGHRVGKEHLVQTAAKHWPVIWGQLSRTLTAKRPLVCTHRDVKTVVQQFSTNSPLELAHWGNLDGKNEWGDCDAAVFFGLPYLDDIAPTHAYFAHQGPKSDDWFTSNRSFGEFADIRRSLQDGFIATSMVQAINRTRCRKPIDRAGNCDPTDVYLLLPAKGETSDLITKAIRHQMPGIDVREWETGATKRKARKAPAEARLLAYFEQAPEGIHLKSAVVSGLRTNTRSFERMTAELRKPSPMAEKLAALRVRYHSTAGRGREAYFTKQ